MSAFELSESAWWMGRTALRGILRPGLRALGFQVLDPERLPRSSGAALLIANHRALVDTLYLQAASPRELVVCGAKPHYFARAPMRCLLRLGNVRRVSGRDDLLAECGAYLESGKAVLIYPEMGRNPQGLGPLLPWAAEAALSARVAAVPCWIAGTGPGGRGPVRIAVGEEVPARGDPSTLTARYRDALLALARRVEPEALAVAPLRS